MVKRADDKILIRDLRLSKKQGAKKFIIEFPEKNWKSLTLKDFKQKMCNAIPGVADQEPCLHLIICPQ